MTPFTSNGYKQPGGSKFVQTIDHRPVSFSRMKGAGMLGLDQRSLEKLYFAAQRMGYSKDNDRPLGGFPAYKNFNDIKHGATIEKVKKVRDFLLKYGDAMVREGLLSK